MTETPTLTSSTIKYRKAMGRIYLNEGRLQDALNIFLTILRDDPREADTLADLGNLYLASGDGQTAAQLFKTVQELDPGRKMIRNSLALAANEQDLGLPEETNPTSTEAAARLLARLENQPAAISEQSIQSAYEMLQRVISSSNPGAEVAKSLDDIEALLPALLELNIRQARADGQHAVAEALQTLQSQAQAAGATKPQAAFRGQQAEPALAPGQEPALTRRITRQRQAETPARRQFRGHVVIILPDRLNIPERVTFMANALRKSGTVVTFLEEFPDTSSIRLDLAIFITPHIRPALVQSMAACAAKGVPLVLDLDADYENLPVFHPDYARKGLGRMTSSKAYITALALADLVTTPSRQFGEGLRGAGHSVAIIPDGWDRETVLEPAASLQRSQIHFGWVGNSGLLEDFASIRRVVMRVLHEFEDSRLVVVGNMQAYQLLEGVPPDRKIFLPENSYSDTLAALRQLDILLMPLSGHPYNNAQPDSLLMKAGIYGIPWIGSPIPSFAEWKAGGLIAASRDEWHTDLRQLILDPQLRQSLGQEGRAAAAQREMKALCPAWLAAVEQALAEKKAKAIL